MAQQMRQQDLRKNLFKAVTAILLFSFVSLLLGEEKVSLRTNFFTDNSGTTVQSPALEVVKRLLTGIDFALRYSLDRVIIPPIRGLAATPTPTDGVTGASRPVDGSQPANRPFTKNRNEVIAGFSGERFGVSFYHSSESDYIGRMGTVAGNFDFNQKNSNLAFSYSFAWDDIRPLGADTAHTRRAHSLGVALTQTLSPKAVGRVGFDLSRIRGFQSNPYRTVNAAGQIVLENHPLWRSRSAFFVKVNRYFTTRTALNLEYRFYRDDWKVQSHTLGAYYYQYLSKKLLLRYRYRYYVQSAAFFYRSGYGMTQQYMTSDYKLEAFNAHLFGFKLEYKLEDLLKNGFLSFLAGSTFEAKYERYFTSRDFTADIFQFGLVLNY